LSKFHFGLSKNTVNIIIPCYNPPHQDWASTIIGEFSKLEKLVSIYRLHLILVNDGSSRGVSEQDIALLKQNISSFQYLTYTQNQGKGYALRKGIEEGEANFYVFTDVDFPYELESVAAVINAVVEKGGIAAGYRNQHYYKKVPLFRKMLSVAFRLFIRVLGIPVKDTQCGLKGFDNAAKQFFIQTKTNRYLFDFEFLTLAARQKNIPIYSVDVELKEGVVFTTMGWKVLRTEMMNLLRILIFK
jgi:glycosyltransferase involved in cell wall biosynthesis